MYRPRVSFLVWVDISLLVLFSTVRRLRHQSRKVTLVTGPAGGSRLLFSSLRTLLAVIPCSCRSGCQQGRDAALNAIEVGCGLSDPHPDPDLTIGRVGRWTRTKKNLFSFFCPSDQQTVVRLLCPSFVSSLLVSSSASLFLLALCCCICFPFFPCISLLPLCISLLPLCISLLPLCISLLPLCILSLFLSSSTSSPLHLPASSSRIISFRSSLFICRLPLCVFHLQLSSSPLHLPLCIFPSASSPLHLPLCIFPLHLSSAHPSFCRLLPRLSSSPLPSSRLLHASSPLCILLLSVSSSFFFAPFPSSACFFSALHPSSLCILLSCIHLLRILSLSPSSFLPLLTSFFLSSLSPSSAVSLLLPPSDRVLLPPFCLCPSSLCPSSLCPCPYPSASLAIPLLSPPLFAHASSSSSVCAYFVLPLSAPILSVTRPSLCVPPSAHVHLPSVFVPHLPFVFIPSFCLHLSCSL